MLALTTPLKARLQALPQLTGWAVRCSTDGAARTALPAVDVRCSGAGIADSRTGAAMVAPEWAVLLMHRRSDDAAELLDAAFAAVFASLHNWQPGQCGGRGWERLQMTRVEAPEFADEGVVGYSLVFTTAARYIGQP